ncbi:LLM class flavin-dependent oxidoreductase [Mycolicibacterium hippocampi]|uniref:Luciferase n=2 Tax=Mycolicibacterium hippocampi TaxID=659824 RepID=A0A7I9ZTZ0_9MYCO|nr:luciferase [Mycolicibacterium hippocampi]
MRIGMTLPVMEPNLDAVTLKAWAHLVDSGPFSSLCWGERMAFDNPESLTLLGAMAAWTDRVQLVTTVLIPQLHDPVMLAKALATADMLSDGRLTVGLGVGGRHEDYRAAGADPATQTMREMAERVAVMRRVWSGEKVTESTLPVGPPPVQAGGPKLLVGTMGPKTMRHAAGWADGLAGTTLDLDVDKQNELFDVARDAWQQAGRSAPHLATSFWFAIGDGDEPRAQVHRHLQRYMNWIPAEIVDAMAPTTGWAGTAEQLHATLQRFADIGTDELHLIPTSADIDQVRQVAEVVGDFG